MEGKRATEGEEGGGGEVGEGEMKSEEVGLRGYCASRVMLLP